jgi:tRNA threonylcarbamoyladenosine biosynthesis protein TsaE
MTFAPAPLFLPDDAATRDLATRIAPLLRAGDTLLLSGPIGAGKTTFARALIRTRMGNPEEEVPSPSFTLVQTYDAPDVTLWHVDLYRLSGPDDAAELGLAQAFDTGLCLIEWPDRLGDLAPPEALGLTFAALARGHSVTFTGPQSWHDRLSGVL